MIQVVFQFLYSLQVFLFILQPLVSNIKEGKLVLCYHSLDDIIEIETLNGYACQFEKKLNRRYSD